MKRTALRPIYSILLLLVIAATLAVRIALHQNGSFYLKYETLIVHSAPPPPTFNATLLKFAATDIAEPKLKQEIDDLLEGNLRGRARHRSFLSSGKYRADTRLRLSRGIPPHLRSPEYYRLWQTFRRSLSDWWRKRRFSSDFISDLANEINLPIKRGKSSKKFKTCAVVGNSGILLESNRGKLIDSHQIVIRLNNARTSTFESHVGSKTTISFVNSNILHLCARRENCYCHPYGAVVPIVMYICQPVHFFDYLRCNSSHKSQLIITDPRFDVLCSKIVKYYSLKRFVEVTGKDVGEWGAAHEGSNFHYSSGMQAVMMAVGMCEEVSVFGFGKTGAAKHHYHTGQKAELALHDYEAEYDLYRDLVKRPQAIPFVSNKFEFPLLVMYR